MIFSMDTFSIDLGHEQEVLKSALVILLLSKMCGLLRSY
jgi:hypothetical protein